MTFSVCKNTKKWETSNWASQKPMNPWLIQYNMGTQSSTRIRINSKQEHKKAEISRSNENKTCSERRRGQIWFVFDSHTQISEEERKFLTTHSSNSGISIKCSVSNSICTLCQRAKKPHANRNNWFASTLKGGTVCDCSKANNTNLTRPHDVRESEKREHSQAQPVTIKVPPHPYMRSDSHKQITKIKVHMHRKLFSFMFLLLRPC